MDYIAYLIAGVLAWIIFYYTIKGAIKNAIIETREKTNSIVNDVPEARTWTVGQIALQQKYEKGEITLEQYKKDWDIV